MLPGGTELPTGVAEQTPCSDGVVGGQEGACRGCNVQHTLVLHAVYRVRRISPGMLDVKKCLEC